MNRLRIVPKLNKESISIPFPGDTTTFVTVGDSVSYGQQLMESRRKKIISSYYLPKLLGVKIEKSTDYVGRINGEFVMEGELLAEKLTTAGMIGKRVVAGVDGVVSVDRIHQGYIDILGEEEIVSTNSILEGTVVELALNKKITLECDCARLDFTFGVNLENARNPKNEEISGEFVLVDDGSSVYTERSLKDSYEGKIVYGGRYLYPELAKEIYQRGAVAIIAYSMDYDTISSLNIPVLVIGGFGQLSMNPDILEIIQSGVGHYMKIVPETYSLFISNLLAIDPGRFKGLIYFSSEIKEGTKVITIEPDNFGVVGTVLEVINDGTKEEVLVELPNNRKVIYHPSLLEVYTSQV